MSLAPARIYEVPRPLCQRPTESLPILSGWGATFASPSTLAGTQLWQRRRPRARAHPKNLRDPSGAKHWGIEAHVLVFPDNGNRRLTGFHELADACTWWWASDCSFLCLFPSHVAAMSEAPTNKAVGEAIYAAMFLSVTVTHEISRRGLPSLFRVFSAVSREVFGNNRSRSKCFRVQPVTC